MTEHSFLRYIAEERNKFRLGTNHNRPLSEDYEYIGLVGEDTFGIEFELFPNLSSKRDGDKGVDFYCDRWRVDVKTLRKPIHILVEENCCKADIYVLAKYDDETDSATLLGWVFGNILKNIPARDTGRGIINHALEIKYLMPMARLHKLLGDQNEP